MTKTTHTPGPWTAQERHERGDWRVSEIRLDDQRTIGAVYSDDVSDDAFEANARLIAAAPDLLAACEPMRDPPTLPEIRTGPCAGTIPVCLTQHQLDAFRAAIAAATEAS